MGSAAVQAAPAVGRTAPAPRYQPLVIVLAAAAAGIVADRFCPLPLPAWWLTVTVAWTAWLVCWQRRWEVAAAAAVLLSAAALAGAWHHCRWRLFADEELGRFARAQAQPVCLEAVALQMPRSLPPPAPNPLRVHVSPDQTQLEIAAVAIRDGAQWRDCRGRSRLLVEGSLPDLKPGDRLLVFGQFDRPEPPQNPGEFDYAAHQRGDRRLSRVRCDFPACVTVVSPGSAWRPMRWLETMRLGGSRVLARHLDPRQAPVAAAVLLGERERIDAELTAAYLATGTIHVLSISGLHVGILAGTLVFLLRRAPIGRGLAFAIVAAATLLYAILVDAQPPVVRAAILVVVAAAGFYLGRQPSGMNSLAAAALVVLAVNPADLFRIGAQLSFLCVAGLIGFAAWWSQRDRRRDPLEQLIAASRGPAQRAARAVVRAAWGLTAAGIVVWCLTLPLVMARFHLFSPVALLLNTLIWLPVELAMLSGFATVFGGGLSAALGNLCGTVCNASFALMNLLVSSASRVPGGHFWVPGPPDWWLAAFYGGLALFAALPRWRPPLRWQLALLGLWTAVGFAAASLGRERDRLDCTFLSMGHGLAVIVELPSGQTLLYDAGRLGAPEGAARTIAAALWSKGITHLDAVVLSHSDADHYNALPELLERFSVGAVYVSPLMFEDETPALDYLKASLQRASVAVRTVSAGERLAAGPDCRLEVLHPPRRGVLGGDNANSLVLAVEHAGRRVLLPGDLERPGLGALLAEEPLHCDVLLVPHHGSQASNPPGLAGWATPNWVVISGSRRWDTEPIEAEYKAIGSRVLHTADLGAVRIRLDRAGVRCAEVP